MVFDDVKFVESASGFTVGDIAKIEDHQCFTNK
jgi:hypothetical protein